MREVIGGDKELRFRDIFLLRNHLSDKDVEENLDDRGRIAIKLMDDILSKDKRNELNTSSSVLNYIEETKEVMEWMISSSIYNTNEEGEYYEIIDIVAVFLIKVYRDYEILPKLVDLIFERNKNDLYIHELIWAFYQSYNVDSLKLICNKLYEEDEKSKNLAYELLNFIPNLEKYPYDKKKYAKGWIENNKDYIYFTDDSKHARSNPVYCKVNLEGRYLGEKVDRKSGKIINRLNNKNKEKLSEFNSIDDNLKVLLSNYSLKLKKSNLMQWKRWMDYPIDKQLIIFKRNIDI